MVAIWLWWLGGSIGLVVVQVWYCRYGGSWWWRLGGSIGLVVAVVWLPSLTLMVE